MSFWFLFAVLSAVGINFVFLFGYFQAITALAHLRSAILYIMDISEQCGRTIEEQIDLFNSIKPLFSNKPLLVVLNKTDIVKLEELSEEKKELLKVFDEEGKISTNRTTA